MTYAIFDMIADSLYKIFGGSLFLPLIIILVITLLVLSVKGGKIVLVIILLPMVTAIVSFGVYSSFFQGLTGSVAWIPVVGWMALGMGMVFVFFKILQ